MDQATPFSSFWTAQTPFIASFALQQLRLWIKTTPWFSGEDDAEWFDVPKDRLRQMQDDYQREWYQLGVQLLTRQPFSFTDKRFASENWNTPLFGSLAAYYLLNARYMMALLDELKIEEDKPRLRLRYLVEQAIAASAPSNFLASNPDAIDTLVKTNGVSLFNGMLHLASDLKEGKLRQCDSGDFKVGEHMATTPGDVVFENDLFQLIQYRPRTEQQYKRPLLIVPPAINKYYILDLQPQNSLIRHALEEGHQVFLVSWRNFDDSCVELTWDDFVQDAVIKAIRVTQAISGERRVNCVGYCIGGTLLCSALAVLAAQGDTDSASSLTLLVTFLDYSDTGVLDVYVDEQLVTYWERAIGGQGGGRIGLFRGQDMANTFSLLRPNELWWNYNVDKYLKGQKPRALDLLFWNNDSTNLPGPMYCWYLRHTYLQNDLKSGELDCCGVKLDLSKITAPAYLVGTQDDHIVPWRGAYQSANLLSGDTRFVLGASGHIAGIINPPAQNKRQYWINEQTPADPDAWFESAEKKPGSWWSDWFAWLAQHSGEQRPAVKRSGNAKFPPLEAAPGRYVLG